ncbi:MAG: glycosyltransferase [Odoribacter sp.]|nr:glycosyltransferase [Odoribacter sp.]
MKNPKVSLIVPTLNAEKYIRPLLTSLNNQTVRPEEIIVIDSSSEDNTIAIAGEFDNVKCIVIDRSTFNHGGTRNKAVKESEGDYILFMTQDALPVNEMYIENLLAPFCDKNVAMVSGKQVARKDASKRERLIREFNYPNEGNQRTKADLDKFGVKTFFFSDACSAYRRDFFMKLGMFDDDLETNEDMLMAAKAIYAGYTVVYESTAQVYHSHNFTLKQQYNRNFTVGRFFAKNSDKLGNVKSESEGIKMAKTIIVKLLKQGSFIECFMFCLDSFMKLVGYKRGMKSISKR